MGGSCVVNKTVTVSASPSISGSSNLCVGLTTPLSSTIPGTWSSSNSAVATVNPSTGVVTAVAPGSVTIIIITSSGCSATFGMTINSLPPAITGSLQVCKGQTTALTDGSLGGTWSSSNTTVATIGVSSGMATGISAGTSTITYSFGSGCIILATLTVNALPVTISGSSDVCLGQSIKLSDSSPGGSWSSSNSGVATVGSSTGIVTGITTGTSTMVYMLPTGCSVSKVITVDPLPGTISGPATVCQTQSITLTDGGVGTWTSSNTTIATAGLTTGVITGINPGVVNITYTIVSTGCYVIAPVTVIPSPKIITGPGNVCVGLTISLSDTVTGGTWTSADISTATINASTGLVNGIASGTVLMSYTVGSGCTVIKSVIVDPISPISGSATVCQGQTILLADTTLGGTWTSRSTATATVDATSGIVTGMSPGPVTIDYLMPTGCKASYAIKVLPSPKPITGKPLVCVGQTTVLSDATPLGTWSSLDPAIAVVASGVVTGMSAGMTLISYSFGGCPATVTVTVTGLPSPILGTPTVCVGQTTTLTSGGTGSWSSSKPLIGSIDPVSGVVTGISAGTTTIMYKSPLTGCFSSVVLTVNSLPGVVTGSTSVCVGQSTTLSDTASGGVWTSSDPGTATAVTATLNSGVITGVKAGPVTVYYTLGTGCGIAIPVTVNPIPAAISGPAQLCVGETRLYTDCCSGSWSVYDTTIAKVVAGTGAVTGISSASTILTYTLPTGCYTDMLITVNPLPAPITGVNPLCVGATSTVYDATPLGSWSSTTPAVTIDGTGDVTGVSAGTSTISYTLPVTGCAATATIIVYKHPAPIAGNVNVCIGSTVTFTDSVKGGLWSSTYPSVASIGSLSGVVNGLALGATTISYSVSPVTGCAVGLAINVVPLPTAYNVSGGGNYCSGGAGLHVYLSGSATGVNYFLYNGGVIATGPVAGTGAGLDFGLQKVAGTYTVLAVNTATGCSNLMTGKVKIIVDPSVTPSVAIATAGGDTVCSGVLTTFTAVPDSGGTAPVYTWSVNGTNVGLTNTYSYVPADGDKVAVVMVSNAHCATPAEVSDTVKMTVSLPQLPVATIRADPGDTICQGMSVTLKAISEYGGSAPVITWMKNATPAATGSTFAYVPDNGDIVYVTMASSYPCVLSKTVNSAPVHITVDSPLIPQVTITASPGSNIGIGWKDTLRAVVTNAGPTGATYQWFVNGMPISNATNATYVSTFNDRDSVNCAVTSSGLCAMTNHNWMYINVSAEGVQQLSQNIGEITVLPNPNKGEFTVKCSLGTTSDEEVTLELTDLLGQVVFTGKTIAKGGNINEKITLLKTLANGMYLLNLRSEVESKVFHLVIEQ